jgi:hypothetical protein
MSLFKLFSAGLIAVAVFTTPTVAKETSAAKRYLAQKQHASGPPADYRPYSHAPMMGPSGAEFGLSNQAQPDGVCDHGDDPQIC